jgi:hypothetical protein
MSCNLPVPGTPCPVGVQYIQYCTSTNVLCYLFLGGWLLVQNPIGSKEDDEHDSDV